MKRSSLSTVILLLVFCGNLKSQNQITETFNSSEYKLIQWILGCQSMAYAVATTQEPSLFKVYMGLGNLWSENASKEYLVLQGHGIEPDEKLKENTSAVIELYQKIFNDPSFARKPEALLALSFAEEVIHKQIIPKLACK
jgi:hypothetical protein